MPPLLCQAVKASRHLCGKPASRGPADTHPAHLHLCGIHKNTYNHTLEQVEGIPHPPGRCLHVILGPWEGAPLRRVRQWCPHDAAEGAPYCPGHEARRLEYIVLHPGAAPGAPVDIVRALVEGMVAQDPPVSWQDAARALAGAAEIPLGIRHRAARQYYRLERTRALDVGWPGGPPWRFNLFWTWVLGGEQGAQPNIDQAPLPPPPPPPGLAALARDGQNVHTRAVTDQTNGATEKLLATKVPESQQTEKTVMLVWLNRLPVSYVAVLRVASDVNRWFNTKDCRTVDDNLYRKLLRGLVALIGSEPDAERRGELYRRLWEECYESMGMCCEGHISRLCNVLVGFDDAFQPPVPFGEILQSKMAAIAAMDVPEEEKRRQATAFFEEHQTPVEERVAWLEAF